MSERMKVGGIVLCGGGSRRMRQPKVWLPWKGEHLLSHVVRVVASVVDPVVVAAAADQELPPLPAGIRIVRDAVTGRGPLAGIAAGLDALAPVCEAAFVTACDHPLLRPTLITRLIELLGNHDAVVPTDGERWHPLTAVYRVRTRALVDDVLSSLLPRATAFAERCQPLVATPLDLRESDPSLDSLRNVNDHDAYQTLLRESGHKE
ncbi:MAG: molybdenum cofactor guanylyltransferase [Phycisphaerae bacterium]|nr:molybdenum cofactor guanylyltransferase [Phycisphaerae bacterium]